MTREDRGPEDPESDQTDSSGADGNLPERRPDDDVPAETEQERTDPPGQDDASGEGRDRPASPGGDRGSQGPTPGPNELYCYSCGTIIKREAEICPECGVRQRPPPGGNASPPNAGPAPETAPAELTTQRQRELERKANNDLLSTLVLSLFTPLFAYVELGKPGYAVLNLLTANYLMLGILIVPLHTYSTITDAREQLRAEGVEGY